jgi:hypothetical protein
MKFTFSLLIIFTAISNAQVPIQYYDFELNSSRNIGETNTEIIVNSLSGSEVISIGGTISTISGNPVSGSALQRSDWDENGITDPGTSAVDYFEFKVSSDGFSGISVTFDALTSLSIPQVGNINILYSDGISFSSSTPQSLIPGGSFTNYTFNLSDVSNINNTDITFRIYIYGSITDVSALAIDNLTISALTVTESKNLGDYQLIEAAAGSFPVFEKFTVNGTAINVNTASILIFSDSLKLLSGVINTGIFKIVLEDTADLINEGDEDSYVTGSFSHIFSGDAVKIFPLGVSGGLRPFTLLTNGLTGAGEINVSLINQNPNPVSLPAGVDKISEIRYWKLTIENSITSLGQILVRLVWGDDDGITDLANVTIAYGSANGNWNDESRDNVSGNSSLGYVEGNFINGQPGDFTFGNLNGGTNSLPVGLLFFKADDSGNAVKLKWRTAMEINSSGFLIERKNRNENLWKLVGELKASGNSNVPVDYFFIDINLYPGKYLYRLKTIDTDGSYEYSNEVNAEVSELKTYLLFQNYPNPFNPSTNISYAIPEKNFVKLEIFNSIGELVSVLVDKEQQSGFYSVQFNTEGLSSGIYLYRLTAGSFIKTKEMILTK